VEPEDGETAERGVVAGKDQPPRPTHRHHSSSAAAPDDGFAVLLGAAGVSIVSLALTIHASPGGTAGYAAVASSPVFYLGVSASFLASVFALRLMEERRAAASGRNLILVLVSAAILRLIAVPAPPALSDDIHRYLWDGHVQASGINPYAYAPADPALDSLATPYRPLINNPDLPTIYPPATQAFFLLCALLGAGVSGMKLAIAGFDLATVLALASILRHRGLNPARVVVYAWSPLAVLESGWSGHVDPVGVFLLVAAVLAIEKGALRVAAALVGLSGAAKYAGWLAVPAILRRAGWKRSLPIAAAAAAAAYLPYLAAGAGVFGSLLAYAERWRFNDSLFSILLTVVDRLGLSGLTRAVLLRLGWLDPSAVWETSAMLRLTEPLSIAKLAAAALFVAFAIRIFRRRFEDPAREILSLIGAALLLSPTVHPWYLLWAAPFLALVPRRSWMWLTYAALVVSYPMMAARTGGDDPLRWLAIVEYAPFFLILAIESSRRRLWERG